MNNLSLRQLRYFEALAQQGHFGRAAEVCAVSQPALSLQMKALEEELGAALFERGARQVRLTALGEQLAIRVRDILHAVDELPGIAQAHRSPRVGRLRIGVIPTVAPYLLPRIIQTLTLRFPGLDLHPRESVTQKLVADLLEARIDAAILALPVTEPSLSEATLFDEEFLLVRTREDQDKPVPKPDMLREMRLLLLEEGHCFREQALAYCKLSPSAPRTLMEGSSLSTLVQMVGAGIGVTLIPEMAVAIETRSAAVSVARLPKPRPARRIGMVWRRSSPMSEQLRHIAGIISEMGSSSQARKPSAAPAQRRK